MDLNIDVIDFEERPVVGEEGSQPVSPVLPRNGLSGLVGGVRRPSNREMDGNYRGFCFQVVSCWRVVVCKDGFQWILQQRMGTSGDCWIGRSYFPRKGALGDVIRSEFGDDVYLSVKTQVDALPI